MVDKDYTVSWLSMMTIEHALGSVLKDCLSGYKAGSETKARQNNIHLCILLIKPICRCLVHIDLP